MSSLKKHKTTKRFDVGTEIINTEDGWTGEITEITKGGAVMIDIYENGEVVGQEMELPKEFAQKVANKTYKIKR